MVIAAGGEVYACGKGTQRIHFLILRMRPIDVKVPRLGEVAFDVPIATNGRNVSGTKVTRIHVAPTIVKIGIHAPGAFGVKVRPNGQIHIVVDGKIEPQSAQIEAFFGFFAIGGHNDSTGTFFVEREEAERQPDYVERNPCHNQIDRSRNDILMWSYFGAAHT